ncbi:MAG: conserved hypothetical protein-putative secreted protein, partial [uncultured Phycisphaerae bacterium]
ETRVPLFRRAGRVGRRRGLSGRVVARGRRAAVLAAGGAAGRPPPRLAAQPRLLLPVHARPVEGGVGEARRGAAPPGAGRDRPVADAGAHAAERRDPRQGRARRLHGREGDLRVVPGSLRQREPVPPQGQDRQITGGPQPARPLAQRAVPLARRRGRAARDRHRRRAVRGRRALPAPDATGHARPHGLRRVLLRHGGLRGQHPARRRKGRRPPPPRLPRAHEHQGKLGPVRRPGRAAHAEHHGPADVELRPRARLPHLAARRRPDPHRRDRRQRRRHADVHALRRRRPPGGLHPRRHGLDRDAGRLHVRERAVPPHRRRQHRPRRGRGPQADGPDRRRRLDEGDHGQGLPRPEGPLRDARRGRPRRGPPAPALPAQLQRRQPDGDVQLRQPPLQARPPRAGHRARHRAADEGGTERLGRVPPRPVRRQGRRGARARARPADDGDVGQGDRRAGAEGRRHARRIQAGDRRRVGRADRPAARGRRHGHLGAEGEARPRRVPADDRPGHPAGPTPVAAVHGGEQPRPRAVADAVAAPEGELERAGRRVDRRERQARPARRRRQPVARGRQVAGGEVLGAVGRPAGAGRVHARRQAARRAAVPAVRRRVAGVDEVGGVHVRLQPPAVLAAGTRRADADPVRADGRAPGQGDPPRRPRRDGRPRRRRRPGAGGGRRGEGRDRHRRVPLRVAREVQPPDVRPRRGEVPRRPGPAGARRAGKDVGGGRGRRRRRRKARLRRGRAGRRPGRRAPRRRRGRRGGVDQTAV